MEDIAKNKTVMELAQLLDEHKGIDTLAMDISRECSWTECFIMTTVRSQAHMGGLVRHVDEYLKLNKIAPLNKKRNTRGQGWLLIDCGNFVIHLMEEEQRSFYELEKLWFKSDIVYQSSKSS